MSTPHAAWRDAIERLVGRALLVRDRVLQQATRAGIDCREVTMQADGFTVILTGYVRSQADLDELVRVTLRVWGVRRVREALRVDGATPRPIEFIALDGEAARRSIGAHFRGPSKHH